MVLDGLISLLPLLVTNWTQPVSVFAPFLHNMPKTGCSKCPKSCFRDVKIHTQNLIQNWVENRSGFWSEKWSVLDPKWVPKMRWFWAGFCKTSSSNGTTFRKNGPHFLDPLQNRPKMGRWWCSKNEHFFEQKLIKKWSEKWSKNGGPKTRFRGHFSHQITILGVSVFGPFLRPFLNTVFDQKMVTFEIDRIEGPEGSGEMAKWGGTFLALFEQKVYFFGTRFWGKKVLYDGTHRPPRDPETPKSGKNWAWCFH